MKAAANVISANGTFCVYLLATEQSEYVIALTTSVCRVG